MKIIPISIALAFLLGCESKEPSKAVQRTAFPPDAEVKAEDVPEPQGSWEFKIEGGKTLSGSTVRVRPSDIESTINLQGGTTLISMRKRGPVSIAWSEKDRAVVELQMPGMRCFANSGGEGPKPEGHTFSVQFKDTTLSEAEFEGEMPCMKGPERIKFSGKFKR